MLRCFVIFWGRAPAAVSVGNVLGFLERVPAWLVGWLFVTVVAVAAVAFCPDAQTVHALQVAASITGSTEHLFPWPGVTCHNSY